MKKSLPTVLATALALGLSLGTARAAETPRLITVTGTGSESAVPDMAVLTLGVEADAPAAEDALAAMSARMQALFAALDAAGLPAKDRQTSGLGLDPIYAQHEESGVIRDEITGYRARNMLTLTLRDIDAIGGLVDALAGAGANRIDGISFDLSDPATVVAAARRAAVADAVARATLYAEAAGVGLGPILSISELGGGMPRPYAAEARAMADVAFAVPVAQGSLSVDAEVTVVFGIAGGETGTP